MPELEAISPKPSVSEVQSPEPITQPALARVSIDEVKATHNMLLGFREGVREGSYQGKHLTHIAQGLIFLDNMVDQSHTQMEIVKREEKEMLKRAQLAIHEANGKVTNATDKP